ncbi:MAG TPA: DUF4097 family beta strand repeat-containing protein [Streptosporangiaceae bacterium]|nr:DUF4097 family beta strand repeat-containing protein [Streptosporangiaceae bacterium]
MSRWTIDEPTTLDFDGVVALKATLVSGNISILASDERPSLHVSTVEGQPLLVTHEAGMLNVTHENLMWEGVLKWLRSMRCDADITVTVPKGCPVTLNLVTAGAVIAGLTARTSIKSGSGDITLDGVTGKIEANTVSGVVEAQGLDGTVSFNSVSGDLALAGGSVTALNASTVSGRIAADIDLAPDSKVRVGTVSGEVALRLPESTSAEVTLSAAAGRIDTSFPELRRQERTITQTVSGKLGAGAGRLNVNTVSGAVTLLRRPQEDAS